MYSFTLLSTVVLLASLVEVRGVDPIAPTPGASFAGYLQATTPGGTLYFLGNFFDSAGLPALTQNASKALFPVGIDQNATFGRILSVLSSGPGDFGQNSTQVGVDNAAVVSVLGDGQQNPVWLIGNNGNVSIYYDNGKGSQNQAAMCTVVDPSTQTAHLRITNTVALPSTAKCDGEPTKFAFIFTANRAIRAGFA